MRNATKGYSGKALRIIAAALIAAMMLVSVLSAAACKKGFQVPEGMTKEEALLFTAVHQVCPKEDNHSKAKYLTFYIGGWSFGEMPEQISTYLDEYCAAGGAQRVQFDFDKLIELGIVAETESDTFYSDLGEHEKVYAAGEGKIFTFALGEGQDPNSDYCIVRVTGYISDHDCHWQDLAFSYEKNAWKYVETVDGGANQSFATPEPNGSAEPQK
ncbi:MAG: hypothetical protein IK064_01195 [Clostridia bacterium]|nr:hypothetical protein [Clostridia bacterium]MBR6006222.1 hypothetical protein [Clostridia bacterium]